MNDEMDTLAQRVFPVLKAIPYGKVTTYGVVARLAGAPQAPRQVGGILKRLPEGSTLPWHRVLNRQGRISLTGEDYWRQRHKLQEEGIAFNEEGAVDLSVYGWHP